MIRSIPLVWCVKLMPWVTFTPHLKMHLDCPSGEVSGATLREALANIFTENPKLRGYILDDQGRLRQHVVIFIDDQVLEDRFHQSDPLRPESQIFIMQALSGG